MTLIKFVTRRSWRLQLLSDNLQFLFYFFLKWRSDHMNFMLLLSYLGFYCLVLWVRSFLFYILSKGIQKLWVESIERRCFWGFVLLLFCFNPFHFRCLFHLWESDFWFNWGDFFNIRDCFLLWRGRSLFNNFWKLWLWNLNNRFLNSIHISHLFEFFLLANFWY